MRSRTTRRALLAWGDRDIAFRDAELARWRAELPQARVVELPGVGHHVPSDAPEAFAAAVAAWHSETLGACRPPAPGR